MTSFPGAHYHLSVSKKTKARFEHGWLSKIPNAGLFDGLAQQLGAFWPLASCFIHTQSKKFGTTELHTHLFKPPQLPTHNHLCKKYKWRFALGKLCRIPLQLPKPSKSLGRFISFIMDPTFKKSWYVFGLKLV